MKKYLLMLFLFGIPHLSNAEMTEPELSVIYENLKEDHADMLRSNFNECDFIGRTKVKSVRVYEESPDGYVVLEYKVEVLEVFKGKNLREITYLYTMEGAVTPSLLSSAGATGIDSLFLTEDNSYLMGDNGYNLPDTPYLLSIARDLAKSLTRRSSGTARINPRAAP